MSFSTDMNETLTDLMLLSCVSTTLSPDRLVMEQMLLIAVLHTNVGNEIGEFGKIEGKRLSLGFDGTDGSVFMAIMVLEFAEFSVSVRGMETHSVQ